MFTCMVSKPIMSKCFSTFTVPYVLAVEKVVYLSDVHNGVALTLSADLRQS